MTSGPNPRRKMADAALMALAAASVIAAFLLLFHLRFVALLAFAAVLAAVIFSAVANMIVARLPVPRGLVVVLVPLALVALIGGVVSLVGAEVASQFTELRERLPGMLDRAEEYLPSGSVEDTLAANLPDGSTLAGWITALADGLTSAVSGLLVALLGGIYLGSSPKVYRQGLAALFKNGTQDDVLAILDKLYRGLKNWLLGQLLSMAIIGTMVYGGLTLLGVPGAVALALLAALFEFIPVIGPFIAAIPAILAALTVSPQLALYTTGFFVVLQQIEGNIIAPIVMRHAVAIPPAITLVSLLMIAALFGPLGIILGGPLTVALFILVREVWVIRAVGNTLDD